MKVSFVKESDRESLIRFLLANGYINGILSPRTTYEEINESVNYTVWPIIHINRDEKRMNFYSNSSATAVAEWPTDAGFIIDFITTEPITMKLSEDYDAIIHVHEKIVEVGCQKIPFDTVDALHKLIHEVSK